MKRGNLVVYCQNDATAGSRFKTVKCYDEAGLRGYLLALDSRQRFPLARRPLTVTFLRLIWLDLCYGDK